MIKKLSILLATVLLISSMNITTFAAPAQSVVIDTISDKYPGDVLNITGTSTLTNLNSRIIASDNTTKRMDDKISVNGSGVFSIEGIVLDSVVYPIGTYTVVVGYGSVVGTKTFNIVPKPTSTPTPTPVPTPPPYISTGGISTSSTTSNSSGETILELQLPEDVDTHTKYINGYSDNTFRPDGSMTRAEFAQIIYNLAQDSTDYLSEATQFSDVKAGAWYVKAIGYLKHNAIVIGNNGMYRPDDSMTRAEFVTIIARIQNIKNLATSRFSDVDGSWARTSILAIAAKGWINGYENGSFMPDKPITRAEVVTVINKIQNRMFKAANHRALVLTFSDVSPDSWYYSAVAEASVTHSFLRGMDGFETWK